MCNIKQFAVGCGNEKECAGGMIAVTALGSTAGC